MWLTWINLWKKNIEFLRFLTDIHLFHIFHKNFRSHALCRRPIFSRHFVYFTEKKPVLYCALFAMKIEKLPHS